MLLLAKRIRTLWIKMFCCLIWIWFRLSEIWWLIEKHSRSPFFFHSPHFRSAPLLQLWALAKLLVGLLIRVQFCSAQNTNAHLLWDNCTDCSYDTRPNTPKTVRIFSVSTARLDLFGCIKIGWNWIMCSGTWITNTMLCGNADRFGRIDGRNTDPFKWERTHTHTDTRKLPAYICHSELGELIIFRSSIVVSAQLFLRSHPSKFQW